MSAAKTAGKVLLDPEQFEAMLTLARQEARAAGEARGAALILADQKRAWKALEAAGWNCTRTIGADGSITQRANRTWEKKT